MDERTSRIHDKLRRELGPLVHDALGDPLVVEILLNPDGRLWVERLGEHMRQVGTIAASQAESAIATVAAALKTIIDSNHPILECELPLDGSRFEALLPPVVASPAFSIRKRASQVFTLDSYVAHGIVKPAQKAAIVAAVEERENILVVGGTGSGKTTLTNAIIAEIVRVHPTHRIVVIEDTAELQVTAPNSVALRANGEVSMVRLLKATMRLRPDRILVGEVRGSEALALLKAWNTGHPGGACTVHANSARAGLLRIEQLVAEESRTPMPSVVAEAVNLIVSIARTPMGRAVQEVVRVKGYSDGQYQLVPVGEPS